MSEYEFTISLRIRHPRLEPSVITEKLGVEPQHSWRAGDPRLTPEGADSEGLYRDSYWMAKLMAEPQLSASGMSVESILLQALTLLRRSQSFLEQLNTEGGAAELSISLFARENFRLELSPETLNLLGRLGLAVTFDIQPHARMDVSKLQ